MATIQDVARHAGVSISTVSYVLSGTRPISAATKERIYRAMTEIGYRPNALAQGLASRRSRIIALLLSPSERGLGSTEMEFVNGAAQAAHEAGYHLVLWADPVETPADLEELGGRGLVEAVLLMEVKLHDWRVDLLANMGIPCALIGRPAKPAGHNWVDIDFEATMADSLTWLQAAGHRHFVLLNQSEQSFASGYGPVVRIQSAFIRQCEERGLSGRTRFCGSDPGFGLLVVRQLWEEHGETTALLVMNDPILPGVMRGLQEMGLQTPQDISLLALLSSPQSASHFWPALSSMDVPGRTLGQLGAKRLIQQLEAGGKAAIAEPTLLPCILSLRGSTGPAPTGLATQRKQA